MSEMWYNLSNIGATDTLGLIQNVNDMFFFHLFGTLFLMVLFIIIFRGFVTYNNNPKVSFMYTAFFIAVLSIIVKLLSLTSDVTVYIAWALFAFSIVLQFLLD